MPSKQLRTLVGLLIAAGLGTSCNRYPRGTEDPAVAGRSLGESTASPGSDPTRPIAQSVDTQDVSVPIRDSSIGLAPRPAPAGQSQPQTPAGAPAPSASRSAAPRATGSSGGSSRRPSTRP